MDTNDLRFFSCVYEQRSINKAARHLFITPQGLSRVIQNLEKELESVLFERTSSGMVPTESGTYLYENCRQVLDKLDEIKIGIRRIRDRDQKLEIGFSCGVLNVFPMKRLSEMKKQCSHIVIRWEESSNQDIINKVLEGILDIGFVIGQMTHKELWVKEKFSRKMNAVVYASHPFYEKESLSVEELRDEPLITLNEKFYSYHSLIQRCQDFGFVPNIAVKTMESQIIYRFCRQGAGIGIDVNIHEDEISMDGLRLIELHDSIPWKISIIVRRDRLQEQAVRVLTEMF